MLTLCSTAKLKNQTIRRRLARGFRTHRGTHLTFGRTYQFKKLTIGGGPRFVGRRFGNNINTRQVESYWTLEAMAAYPVTSKLDLRLNLYNLNDAYYFDRLGGGHLVPGCRAFVNVEHKLPVLRSLGVSPWGEKRLQELGDQLGSFPHEA